MGYSGDAPPPPRPLKTPTKIALFESSDYNTGKTEREVNEFIKNKKVIDIKITSEGASNGHSFMIMVMYE